ncbi:sialidase family protein [Roseococcus microcysteis]|uniref:sialidase family protein n=1 Tax=Roseococcus microcysteis TaxID=2771361 RepID=UPI00168A4569|nr:sialidase family protein [Roseococcus microcysteis]
MSAPTFNLPVASGIATEAGLEAQINAGFTALYNGTVAEAEARAAAIAAEASTRAAAITAESAARIAADDALQDDIEAEEAARIAADEALQDATKALRITGDTVLSDTASDLVAVVTAGGRVVTRTKTDGWSEAAAGFRAAEGDFARVDAGEVVAELGDFDVVEVGDTSLDVGDDIISVMTRGGRVLWRMAPDGLMQMARLNVRDELIAPPGFLPPDPVSPVLSTPRLVTSTVLGWVNAAGALNRPSATHPPGSLSTDTEAYGVREAHLAPGIAVTEGPGPTGKRIWVAAYGQNTRPGEGGEGDMGFTFLRFSDDNGATWFECLYIAPAFVEGSERANIDPQLYTVPDGRLLVLYGTSNPSGFARSAYGFLINNPSAEAGAFEIGRQYWLGYGIPMLPFLIGRAVHVPIDQWSVNMRINRLDFSGWDGITSTVISESGLIAGVTNNIFESSVVALAGNRLRQWRRTASGTYTSRSDDGGATWGAWSFFSQGGQVQSRACAARSPSGRIVLVQNYNLVSATRINMTCWLSEDEAETFSEDTRFTFDSRAVSNDGGPTKRPQYPVVTWIGDELLCAVDFGRLAASNPKEIVLQRYSERAQAAGTITESDVIRQTVAT